MDIKNAISIANVSGIAWVLIVDNERRSLWYAESGAKFRFCGDNVIGVPTDLPGIVSDFFANYRPVVGC